MKRISFESLMLAKVEVLERFAKWLGLSIKRRFGESDNEWRARLAKRISREEKYL